MNTIPVFIPFVNRRDLLDKAIASVPHNSVIEPVIINNSGKNLDLQTTIITPESPITFSQTQNLMLNLAKKSGIPFYFFLHSDAEAEGDTVERLYWMAMDEFYGVIFTAYDSLAAFNTAAFDAIGGWDEKLHWYRSDCDVYRRLRLAGYPTIESNLPVKHTPSQTLNSDPEIQRRVVAESEQQREYYIRKWGGEGGKEIFDKPFNYTKPSWIE